MRLVQREVPYPTVVSPGRAALGFACVALATTVLRSEHTHWLFLGLAVFAAVALVAAAVALPRRLPTNALFLLPLLCDTLVALLREAQGGAQSGYAALLVLPVVWVAFVGGRRSVLLVVAALAATLAIPIIVVGGPSYPGTGWRGALLLTLVTAIVGLVVEHGVRTTRAHADTEMQRARMLDRLVQTQSAIAMSDFGFEDVMQTVVDEALALTSADAAVIELPDGADLVYRAVAGTAEPYLGLRIPADGSASGYCLANVEPLVVLDAETDERVDREACRQVGARSMVVVPLIHA
ncbi:MAG: GAF domain-containing protein, partial [Gaiellaceae bacterium]